MANKLMSKEEDIQQAAKAIKAIAHPLRLKILCVLGDREVSVQDIVEQVGTSQSNISQHLAICVTRAYWPRARMRTGCITG